MEEKQFDELSLEEKRYVELVDRLEVYSREHPAAYRLRVGLLAALGYLYLFAVVGGIVLLVGAVMFYGKMNYIVFKLLWIPTLLAAVVLNSLRIKFPKPEGHELKSKDAPRLFDLIKEVQQAVEGPRVHKVLLTDDFNAGIVQRPRLGILGWQMNYLVVGLPYLKALSVDDVRAVIAHEFGHLSGSHGKFSGWIYRVRQTWVQILTKMKQQGRRGSVIFEWFFEWYAPYFEAYSFVLARAQEYEADRCSVAVSGKEHAARALINSELKAQALSEDFWSAFYRQADKLPEPPQPFTAMLQALGQPISSDKARLWFSQSLTRRHDYYDTHPSLADRLAAIGYPEVRANPEIELFGPAAALETAEHYLLGAPPAGFIAGHDLLWKEGMTQRWQERYQFVCNAEESLAALEEKAKTESLSLDEHWERARFVAGTKGYQQALPFLREVVQLEPDHVAANYMLGEALLQEGDEAGIKHLKLAMDKDADAIPAGGQLIYYFLSARERTEEAEPYRRLLNEHYEKVDLATEERNTVSTKDEFRSHDLSPEAVAGIRAQLAPIMPLGTAYLVKKVVRHFPENPCYILGIIIKTPWYKSKRLRDDKALVDRLASEMEFPGSSLVVPLEQDYKPLRKLFQRIPGSEIYRS